MQNEEPQNVDSNTLCWVTTGTRNYAAATLFGHLMFLNTYFPDTWSQEYTKLLKHIHGHRFYDEENIGNDEKDSRNRTRMSYYAVKYILGHYDWDDETDQMVEPFPTCYGFPLVTDEEIWKEKIEIFKKRTFPYLWYTFSRTSENGSLEVYDARLLEKLKEGFKGKRIGTFTDLSKDLQDPYTTGIGFRLFNDIQVPTNLKQKSYLKTIDLIGFLICVDYSPNNQRTSYVVEESQIGTAETDKMIQSYSIKCAIHNTFYGHIPFLWNMDKERITGTIKPEAVARNYRDKTNGIYLYAELLSRVKDNTEVISSDVRQTLEQVGFLDPKLIEKDFGMIKTFKKKIPKKKETTKDVPIKKEEKSKQKAEVSKPASFLKRKNPFHVEKPAIYDVIGIPTVQPSAKKVKRAKKEITEEEPMNEETPDVNTTPELTSYQDPDVLGNPPTPTGDGYVSIEDLATFLGITSD